MPELLLHSVMFGRVSLVLASLAGLAVLFAPSPRVLAGPLRKLFREARADFVATSAHLWHSLVTGADRVGWL